MTDEQASYISLHLKGCAVDDIGCGYTNLRAMMHLFDYRGFDKEAIPNPNTYQVSLSRPCSLLRYDVAFVSWPINHISIAWHLFLPKYKEVVYLGSNHSGICCGDKHLWKFLGRREVLAVLPDRAETLIHYGHARRAKNAPVPFEEKWGREAWEGGLPAQFVPDKFYAAP